MANYLYVANRYESIYPYCKILLEEYNFIPVVLSNSKTVPPNSKVIKWCANDRITNTLDLDFILLASEKLNNKLSHSRYVDQIFKDLVGFIKKDDVVIVWGSGEFTARAVYEACKTLESKCYFVESFIFKDTIQISYKPFLASKYGTPEWQLRLDNMSSFDQEDIDYLNRFYQTSSSKYSQSISSFNQNELYDFFVVGQVPIDVNVLLVNKKYKDSDDLCINLATQYPDKKILYKPHPMFKIVSPKVKEHSNILIVEGSIHDIFKCCSEVHTISSTVGIEALLYNKKVVWHSDIFYSKLNLIKDEDKFKFISVCRKYMIDRTNPKDQILHHLLS